MTRRIESDEQAQRLLPEPVRAVGVDRVGRDSLEAVAAGVGRCGLVAVLEVAATDALQQG